MMHIYLQHEEENHDLNDEGSTCNCGPRIRILSDGTMLCIHSPVTEGHREMNDEFIDEVLDNIDDTDGNISVDDV